MSAKPTSRSKLAVRTPTALAALAAWTASLPSGIRQRGKEYHRQGRVCRISAVSGSEVEAVVEGGADYDVTLTFLDGSWSSRCTCPMEADCKHVVAASLAWTGNQGTDFNLEDDPPNEAVSIDAEDEDFGVSPQYLSKAPIFAQAWNPRGPEKQKRESFREKWAPLLTHKLGRPLADHEARMLGQLSALFAETRYFPGGPSAHALRQHGFDLAIPPGAPAWGPALEWYEAAPTPTNPWELWQYLALSLELNGHPIPEAFRPMTNTAPLRALLEDSLMSGQLEMWREALEPRSSRLTSLAMSGIAGLRARFSDEGNLVLESRSASDKPWKPVTQRGASAIARLTSPADAEALPIPEAALAVLLAFLERRDYGGYRLNHPLAEELVGAVLAFPTAREAVLFPDLRPVSVEPEPLVPEAVVSTTHRDRLEVRLVLPDGTPAPNARLLCREPEPLYWHDGRIRRGPLPLPSQPLPFAALADPQLHSRLRKIGIRLPGSLELKRRTVTLQPRLRMWVHEENDRSAARLHVQLLAQSEDPEMEQQWCGPQGWHWTEKGAPPARRPNDPILELDATAADMVAAQLPALGVFWDTFESVWSRNLGPAFPDQFTEWRSRLPAETQIEVSSELAGLLEAPLRAKMDFSAIAADANHDWFDLTVALRVEDTTLTPDEIALLLKARGKWVRLPKRGWRRLELDRDGATQTAATLDRLGITAEDVWTTGGQVVHRLHALQMAAEADGLEQRDAKLAAALRQRAAEIQSVPPPSSPAGLTATLRPYQHEGFHFLAHLSRNRFGGVLADDMGLGKTVQALAWLLHLAAESRSPKTRFRALVICPKSVMHGWIAETARFAPELRAQAFEPAAAKNPVAKLETNLLVANYTQLRLNAEWFQSASWDAVILDEGQFIKNPTSQTAAVARELRCAHRLVLTGTPVENRLTDLWSLFAFAQPGLLGTQTAFRRQYDEKDPAALARVHRRVRHFLLRRTKAQAAPDLPARTEDDLLVDLEPGQRKLYDAELKRARQQLLGIESNRAFDKVRFNVLASLLRLRQICCHPALVDPAHASLASAKLEALIERLEELRDEGHQVLVFSQFVEMLELIRTRLVATKIGHLMLTGATENRAELTETFQSDRSKTVFLLSLKAAGFGLNLTAASYAVLYDPWWNPAVEAQAIDRTHRIGQTRPVIAYRFLARNTIEEKIRALQREKAALAAAVVKEESLSSVLDLESLKKILG